MNIFYLSNDVVQCAQWHVDRHVVKMILELAQLLSTAHHILHTQSSIVEYIYKPTHINHSCAIWVRQSVYHYNYTYQLFKALCDEYTHRYGKVHTSYQKLNHLLCNPPEQIPQSTWIDPPCAMPKEYILSNAMLSYRNYYILGKKHLHKYTKRSAPVWLTE
jgi:hypothetical protein